MNKSNRDKIKTIIGVLGTLTFFILSIVLCSQTGFNPNFWKTGFAICSIYATALLFIMTISYTFSIVEE